MHCRYILAAAFVLVCGGHVFSEDGATFVRDLTHKLHSGIPTHSAVLKPTIQTYFSSLQNVIYKIENISTASHVGTHVDAPSHFANGTWDIDEIPLQRLFAPAVVVDIRYKTLKDPESGLSPADLITWELKYGKIPDGAVILVLTGWDRYWKDPRKYLRIEEDGAKGSPGVSGEAAEWIVENTKAYGIGVDGISIDTGNDVIAHLILCRNSLYLIENLKDVDKIPPVGATLYVLPLKIKSASGAPARVISTYPV